MWLEKTRSLTASSSLQLWATSSQSGQHRDSDAMAIDGDVCPDCGANIVTAATDSKWWLPLVRRETKREERVILEFHWVVNKHLLHLLFTIT